MFHKPYPKSPLLKMLAHPAAQSSDVEFKINIKSIGNEGDHVKNIFKLSNSRALVYQHSKSQHRDELFILDLNTNPPSKTSVPCSWVKYPPDYKKGSSLDFYSIENCWELTNDRFVLHLVGGDFSNPKIRQCLFDLRSGKDPMALTEKPFNYQHTARLSPTLFACFRLNRETNTYSINLLDTTDSVKTLAVTELKKKYNSLAALNSHTLILGSSVGEVDIYQLCEYNQFKQVSSLTSELNKYKYRSLLGCPQQVKIIGKDRNILLIADLGLISTWRWDEKANQFKKIAHAVTPITNLADITELDDGEHFALFSFMKEIPAVIANTQLEFHQNPKFKSQFIDFPEGCCLSLSDGKLTKMQLDYRDFIKQTVDAHTPLGRFGALSKYIAEYTCIGEDKEESAEKVALQASKKM
ncbi:MAG: hypothetical protein ACYCQI_10760 [Gammaproteobacteria bacterium]